MSWVYYLEKDFGVFVLGNHHVGYGPRAAKRIRESRNVGSREDPLLGGDPSLSLSLSQFEWLDTTEPRRRERGKLSEVWKQRGSLPWLSLGG